MAEETEDSLTTKVSDTPVWISIFRGLLSLCLISLAHVILFYGYKGEELTNTQIAVTLFDFLVGMYYFFPQGLKEVIAHVNPLIPKK